MVKPRLDDPLTADQLRTLLDYEPETGIFTWRRRLTSRREWNTRYADKPAGTPTVPRGYIQIMLDTRLYLAHRLAHLWMTGSWPLDEIDHRDTNPANNAWSNLRPATSSQQKMNSTRRSDNASGYKGVYWESRRRYWYFEIRAHGRRETFANYDTAEEAHAARLKVLRSFHGTFARTE